MSTNREIVTDALRKLGVVSKDEPADANDIADGLRQLNRMLKGWQNRGLHLWTQSYMSITLTAGTKQYTLPLRPFEIMNVQLRRSTTTMPMQQLTRNEYDDLPNKLSQGVPTCWQFYRKVDTADMFIWPVLAAANGEHMDITYNREIATSDDLDAEIDVPIEFEEAVVYNLAARLADDYERNVPNIVARAERELELALAADREGSVFFGDYYS